MEAKSILIQTKGTYLDVTFDLIEAKSKLFTVNLKTLLLSAKLWIIVILHFMCQCEDYPYLSTSNLQ